MSSAYFMDDFAARRAMPQFVSARGLGEVTRPPAAVDDFLEGFLHVLRLQDLVLPPLEVNRRTGMPHSSTTLGSSRNSCLIRDHFAAAAKPI